MTTYTNEQINKIYQNKNELGQLINTIANEGPSAARKLMQEIYSEDYAKAVVAHLGERMMVKNLS